MLKSTQVSFPEIQLNPMSMGTKPMASIYPCPENPQERREVAMGVMTRIQDLDQVLSQTNEQRNRILASVARNIRVWFIKVRKVAGIYHTLNMFSVDLGQKCLIGEAWCPVADIDRIQLALRRGTERCGGSVNSILQRIKSNMTPPTYFRTNKFTSSFQARVSTPWYIPQQPHSPF